MLCVFIFFLLLGFLLGCLLWCPWACSFVWALRSPCVLSEWPLRQQRGEQATHAGAIRGWSLSFLLCRKLEACLRHGMATSRLSHGSHKTSLASSSILCAPYGHGPSPFRWQRTRRLDQPRIAAGATGSLFRRSPLGGWVWACPCLHGPYKHAPVPFTKSPRAPLFVHHISGPS